jgi:hypothetical protein
LEAAMTRTVLALVFAILAGFTISGVLRADVLLIEEVRQAGNMDVPVNGMKKADVSARYGDPAQVHAAVGDPPITRWDYGQWSVYFEYDTVLFTVVHKDTVKDKKSG